MARRSRPQMTSVDYVVIALSPALIMALVGSLCFFLLEIGYRGQFDGRLNWILFWFVFAIVLIARISIEEGKEKALFYGLALSGAVALVVLKFVDSPLVAWGLLAVVWWCANKLTWDCTVIDDEQDASGEGLLQVAGLDRAEGAKADEPQVAEEPRDPVDDDGGHKRRRNVTWWQRWLGAVEADENQKNPHAPGVWVVYFSLAALPLFGLGQSMVPAGESDRRRYVFWLLLCYVAAALGLLLTTSFLGLRRYLRQRKLEMPLPMTGVWLGVGAALIVVLLLVGVMLPRPSAEYPVAELIANVVGSPTRRASDYAVLTDSHGEGQGRPSSEASGQASGEQAGNQSSGGQQGGSQQGGSQQGGSQQGGKQQGGKQQGGKQQGGSQQGGSQQGDNQSGGSQQGGGQEQGGSQQGGSQQGDKQQGGTQQGGSQHGGKQSGGSQQGGGQQGGSQQGGSQQGGSEQGGSQQGGKQAGSQQGGSQQGGSQQAGSQQGGNQSNGQQTGGQQGDKQSAGGGKNEPSKDSKVSPQQPAGGASSSQSSGQGLRLPTESKSPPKGDTSKKPDSSAAPQPQKPPPKAPWLPKFNWSLASWIRWLIYGAMLAAAIYGFLRYREQVLAFLRQMIEELKSIWREIFGRKRPTEAEGGAEEPRPIPRPFASFADPFVNGAAAQSKPDQLVRYTFAALEAWAFGRGAARRPEATPHEFARQIGDGTPEMAADVQALANHYAQIVYARGSLTPECLPALRRLWQQLRARENAVA